METADSGAVVVERLAAAGLELVCPACRDTPLDSSLHCSGCGREFPVVGGIPDLRLEPDRFLSIGEDRAKGLRVAAAARDQSYHAALEAYWQATPDVDPKQAARHLRRQRAEAELGRLQLAELERRCGPTAGPFLDLGCGLGGLVAAAGAGASVAVGVDAAFRRLLIAQRLLDELGSTAVLICANAETPPFREGAFATVAVNDLLEHVADPARVVAAAAGLLCGGGRLRGGGRLSLTSNNRYSLAPEPHIGLFGVGFLPHALQRRYVEDLRGRDYSRVRLLSPAEAAQLCRNAGLTDIEHSSTPILSAHLSASEQRLARLADRLGPLAPRFQVTAARAGLTALG